jgi:hypothetical protein
MTATNQDDPLRIECFEAALETVRKFKKHDAGVSYRDVTAANGIIARYLEALDRDSGAATKRLLADPRR